MLVMSEFQSKQETQLSPEQLLQAGREFLDHFGVEVDPLEQADQFMDAMKQLDPRFAEGRSLVRWELASDQREWPLETKAVIMSTVERMRMLEKETPLDGNFDVVIALGGANQQNHERPRYAAEAIKAGEATAKYLIVAGSSRPLNDTEQKNTENYAPGAKTEFDLCVAGAGIIAKENPDLPVSVLFVDNEKAGTPDVIEKVLASLKASGALKDNAKVAAITTQIYQASTELDLARVAKKFGITETATAGIPSPAKTVEGRSTATYLSEIVRTLKAVSNSLVAQKQNEVSVDQQTDEDQLSIGGKDRLPTLTELIAASPDDEKIIYVGNNVYYNKETGEYEV